MKKKKKIKLQYKKLLSEMKKKFHKLPSFRNL